MLGTIRDANGAPIGWATATVTSGATANAIGTVTDDQGNYDVPQLRVAGFKFRNAYRAVLSFACCCSA